MRTRNNGFFPYSVWKSQRGFQDLMIGEYPRIVYERDGERIELRWRKYDKLQETFDNLMSDKSVKVLEADGFDDGSVYANGKWYAYDPYSLSHWE